ncbi:MAG: AbrB/MazE/SpoVT family DNA-binding domain-containing protein [Candidatus Neomarinimicrobiota bacterium]
MRTKIQKWGNSLALRIPKAFAKETNISDKSIVNLSIEDDHLVIFPIDEPDEYELDSLLSQIDQTNLHSEINWGQTVGKELS